MLRSLTFALLALGLTAPAAAKEAADPAAVEMTTPVFEMFRLVPGKTEEFIRDMEKWDKVSAAGGPPPTQLFLHAGGEGWDGHPNKAARPNPSPVREGAMAAKRKEMGLPTGMMYFVDVREKMADHVHFEGTGPLTAANWVAQIESERAAKKRGK
ncbi:MAG: hypothetical protein IBJ13_12595 [Sphingopyxis sp.]|nr:hypothetical protein [Sphingopyxis sp.]